LTAPLDLALLVEQSELGDGCRAEASGPHVEVQASAAGIAITLGGIPRSMAAVIAP
jgi:hypothetical protein